MTASDSPVGKRAYGSLHTHLFCVSRVFACPEVLVPRSPRAQKSSCPEGTRLEEANVHNRRCLSRRVRYLRIRKPPPYPRPEGGTSGLKRRFGSKKIFFSCSAWGIFYNDSHYEVEPDRDWYCMCHCVPRMCFLGAAQSAVLCTDAATGNGSDECRIGSIDSRAGCCKCSPECNSGCSVGAAVAGAIPIGGSSLHAG